MEWSRIRCCLLFNMFLLHDDHGESTHTTTNVMALDIDWRKTLRRKQCSELTPVFYCLPHIDILYSSKNVKKRVLYQNNKKRKKTCFICIWFVIGVNDHAFDVANFLTRFYMMATDSPRIGYSLCVDLYTTINVMALDVDWRKSGRP